MQDSTRKFVQVTVSSQSAVMGETLTALHDTAMTTAMDLVLATPPTGYQVGSIDLKAEQLVYDGTNYIIIQAFVYQVNAADA